MQKTSLPIFNAHAPISILIFSSQHLQVLSHPSFQPVLGSRNYTIWVSSGSNSTPSAPGFCISYFIVAVTEYLTDTTKCRQIDSGECCSSPCQERHRTLSSWQWEDRSGAFHIKGPGGRATERPGLGPKCNFQNPALIGLHPPATVFHNLQNRSPI